MTAMTSDPSSTARAGLGTDRAAIPVTLRFAILLGAAATCWAGIFYLVSLI